MAVSVHRLAVIAICLAIASPAIARSPRKVSIDRVDPANAAVSRAPAKVLTGKERLGDKSTDEQRLDNCKVPVEKRGVKKRSGTCDHLRIGSFSPTSATTWSSPARASASNALGFTRDRASFDSPSSQKARI